MANSFRIRLISLFLLAVVRLSAQDLPRFLTPGERLLLTDYSKTLSAQGRSANAQAPASAVRTIAEWEELQALLVAWKSYPSILRQIVKAAKTETRVLIAYEAPDSPASLTSYLAAGGVDTVNVTFLPVPINSVWSRDYGPWSVYTNDVDTLATVDWIYNRPRAEDDAVPSAIATLLGTPFYQTLTPPDNLVHTGGNFMTDGFGTGFSSTLVLEENSPAGGFGINHTPAEVDSIMLRYMGISRYIRMDTLPNDVIHHIDMHMKLLDEETILMGQYPPGISDGPQIEANLLYVLSNFPSVFGTPYKVVRIPMPDDNGLYPSTGGDYFTYTNSSFINKTVILPVYGIPEDSIAVQTYRENLPGYKIVPINCAGMIGALGALHCITKEIGAENPLLISHQPLPNTTDTINSYTVTARMQHRTGVIDATLFWRTDTLQPWQQVMMNPVGPTWLWSGSIPAQASGTRVYYYISAMAQGGKTQVRPMPAPTGYWTFDVTAPATLLNDTPPSLLSRPVFPNPCSAMTCIELNLPVSGTLQLDLLDALGRRVIPVFSGWKPAGEQRLFFDAGALPDGIYQLMINSYGHTEGVRLIVRH